MKLNKYFTEIESSAFQNQFSVLSGIEVVQFALSRDETIKGLLAEIIEHPNLAAHLHDRILWLLPKVAYEDRLSYDESIVAYLHCLEKTDLLLAHRASLSVWSTEGLLWSRWLAHKIIEFVRQIEDSVQFSTVMDEPTKYIISDRIELDKADFFVVHLKSGAFVVHAELKERQLTLLSLSCDDTVESDGKESTVSDATLQFNVDSALAVELSVVD